MHGNVWEWLLDRYVPYRQDDAIDLIGASSYPRTGRTRFVVRGRGRRYFGTESCRSASRHGFDDKTQTGFIGFRIMLDDFSK